MKNTNTNTTAQANDTVKSERKDIAKNSLEIALQKMNEANATFDALTSDTNDSIQTAHNQKVIVKREKETLKGNIQDVQMEFVALFNKFLAMDELSYVDAVVKTFERIEFSILSYTEKSELQGEIKLYKWVLMTQKIRLNPDFLSLKTCKLLKKLSGFYSKNQIVKAKTIEALYDILSDANRAYNEIKTLLSGLDSATMAQIIRKYPNVTFTPKAKGGYTYGIKFVAQFLLADFIAFVTPLHRAVMAKKYA